MNAVRNLAICISICVVVFVIGNTSTLSAKISGKNKTEIKGNEKSAETIIQQKLESLTEKTFEKGGQLLLLEEQGGRIKYRTCVMRVNAPGDKLWHVLTDFENYKDFVPEMIKSEIISKKGNEISVAFEVSVKFMMVKSNHEYKTKYRLEKPKIVIIDYDKNTESGYWEVVPTDDGKKTMLVYSDMAPDPKTLGSMAKFLLDQKPEMEMALQVSPVTMYVKSMKKRAEEK